MTDEKNAQSSGRSPDPGRWRAKAFSSTWLAYAGFYFCRKAFYAVKPAMKDELGLGWSELGDFGLAYLIAYTVGQFREALTGLADEPRLLIELSDVPFMDSAGLGALIGGIRRARENENKVVVSCGRATLTRLLHTTGFDRIVPVTESVEEGLAAFDTIDD